MLGKIKLQNLGLANPLELISVLFGTGLCLAQFFFPAAMIQAAIIGTGDIDPENPAGWTSATMAYIGKSSVGSISVDGGSILRAQSGYLGYDSGSDGTAEISGTSSVWSNSSSLYIGKSGSGILNVKAGGVVSTRYYGYLGYGTGATGVAKVTGAGSKLTADERLYVGYSGSGTLNVEAGGKIQTRWTYLGNNSGSTGSMTITDSNSVWNGYGLYVGNSNSNATLNIFNGGYASDQTGSIGEGIGSFGTATVSGTGSQWSNSVALYVGRNGNGTLTVTDGGLVTAKTLYATPSNLLGNGTITVQGAVLDTDLIFDGTHGLQQAMTFGSGGTLNLNINGGNNLGAGYKSNGTLRIADGINVSSSDGYLGYMPGSSGVATVTGTNSKWDANRLYIGNFGNGAINVTNGGTVTAGTLYASLNNLFGNGTINAQGAVLDTNLFFDSSHGLQQTIPFGTGGTLNLNINANYGLGAGHKGNGSLRIADGVSVTSALGQLGNLPGSVGTAKITGTNSKWTISGLIVGISGSGVLNIESGGQVSNSSDCSVGDNTASTGSIQVIGMNSKLTNSGLRIGDAGTGTMNIETGGQVSNSYTVLGYDVGSIGTATITGSGSLLTNTNDLFVGRLGSGQLVVTNGGVVGVGGVLYASLNKLSGNGTINAYGAVLDANLVFDATHGTPQTIAFGSGGTLNLQSTKELGVGYKGIGTLRISGGKAVSCGFGYLGYMADSTGTATVTGTGSLWSGSNTALCIGYSGNGILNVEAGGHVSFFSVSLSGTKSTATISGSGSLLNGTARLTVNQGTLNIESGGQVTCATGTVDSSSIVTLIGTDSSWTIEDELTVGDSVNGILNIGANQSPGGSVQATKLTIAKSSGSGICNINNGGKLLASNILKGNGTATFNWNDGTIKNFGNLAISNNLDLKLAETGTHTFNIDSNRTGTINSILSDASSGGTLDKIGAGTLLLTAVNTYSGGTTVEEGRFKVTGSILNTSGITVGETAILELAKNSGSATAANVPIDNDGKLLISIGSQNTGMITGNGTTQVYAGATLTAASIMQDTLIIGGTAASWASSSESSSANQVPEPSAITLVFAGFLGVLFPIWRRKLG